MGVVWSRSAFRAAYIGSIDTSRILNEMNGLAIEREVENVNELVARSMCSKSSAPSRRIGTVIPAAKLGFTHNLEKE